MYGKKTGIISFLITLAILFMSSAMVMAAQYKLDPAHSFVEFRIQHLGFSWLYGRFNEISGEFTYDKANPAESRFTVEIATDSIDTKHAERDKHLRSKDFLHVSKYPKAVFKSTAFDGSILHGVLTLHGVSKTISMEVNKVGEGKDPWGGYRAGFEGKVTFKKSDFGIDYDLGPSGEMIEFNLGIEGIRQ